MIDLYNNCKPGQYVECIKSVKSGWNQPLMPIFSKYKIYKIIDKYNITHIDVINLESNCGHHTLRKTTFNCYFEFYDKPESSNYEEWKEE